MVDDEKATMTILNRNGTTEAFVERKKHRGKPSGAYLTRETLGGSWEVVHVTLSSRIEKVMAEGLTEQEAEAWVRNSMGDA